MIELIVVVKRNAAMSPAHFHHYWRTEHARKTTSIVACANCIRRYVQARTLEQEYATGDSAFDGTAELWFDSFERTNAFVWDAEYLAIVAPVEVCSRICSRPARCCAARKKSSRAHGLAPGLHSNAGI